MKSLPSQQLRRLIAWAVRGRDNLVSFPQWGGRWQAGHRLVVMVVAALTWLSAAAAPAWAISYTFTKIADTSSPFSDFGGPSINSGGTVAFLASLDVGGSGIFTGSGGPITTIADSSGPFSGFFGDPSLNNGGTVAFVAGLDAGGGGIFTGPDPVADKVILIGDALDGSTVLLTSGLAGLGAAAWRRRRPK